MTLLSWTRVRQCIKGAPRTSQRRPVSKWTQGAKSNLIQSYISISRDPYLNLSVEHFLLQNSPPQSVVLFLYVNQPCVVIGRNQNPWLELNLRALKQDRIDIIRRRSGGGAVFHDEGNVNWTVICPPAKFSRDRHAEMVVRALRSAGISRARVNQRHDIVLDQGTANSVAGSLNLSPSEALHRTPYTTPDESGPKALKVSGSAYKLTRTRALHHGTCLLNSRHLTEIPRYLRSPAKPFILAKGVESVRSPVANVGLGRETFQALVQTEFTLLHGLGGTSGDAVTIADDALEDAEVMKGFDELKTMDWTFLQTPHFTVSSQPMKDDPREGPRIQGWSSSSRFSMKVKGGIIQESWLSFFDESRNLENVIEGTHLNMDGRKLHEVRNWHNYVEPLGPEADGLAKWLDTILPTDLDIIKGSTIN